MTTTSNLAWVDIETTGLDPEVHDILEIGIIVTDRALNEIARKSWVMSDAAHEREWSREALEMHKASGLVDELAHGLPLISVSPGKPSALAEAESFIREHGAVGSPMCGASVHFDRAFLRHLGDRFVDLFHYRNLDVSSLRLAAELAGLDVPERKRDIHRALPDLDDSIALARWCVGRMNAARMARCLDAEATLDALRETADYHEDRGGTDLGRALAKVGER